MASYHFNIKNDKRPDKSVINPSDHADYIYREGKYKDHDKVLGRIKAQQCNSTNQASDHADYINRDEAFINKGGCVYKEHHLPAWANGSPRTFFAAADKHEAKSRTRYREIEFALPNELKLQQNREIIDRFVENHLGKDFYYALAVHDKLATMGNGEQNSHVHIMFCERKIDETERNKERTPDLFFLKANPDHPERGGPKKDEKWVGADRGGYVYEMRKDFALIQNSVLEKYGFEVRVDHRSLKKQREEALKKGDIKLAKLLDRAAEQHIGPAIAGQKNHADVIELQKYRMVKLEHQKLLKATEYLEQAIIKEQVTTKINATIASGEYAVEKANRKNDHITDRLATLRHEIISVSKEIAAVKDMVVWHDQALAQARRNFMEPDELEIETNLQIISQEVMQIKQIEKQLRQPPTWNKQAFTAYKDLKAELRKNKQRLNHRSENFAEKLKQINKKFMTHDMKLKIEKAKKIILAENQPAKDMLLELTQKLEVSTTAMRQLLLEEVEQKRPIGIVREKYEAELIPLISYLYEENSRLQAQKQQANAEEKPQIDAAIVQFAAKFDKAKIVARRLIDEGETLTAQQMKLNQAKSELPEPPPFYAPNYTAWAEMKESLEQKEKDLERKIKEHAAAVDKIKCGEINGEGLISAKERYTAQQVKDILDPLLNSLVLEVKDCKKQIELTKHSYISAARAADMARNVYAKGEFKVARKQCQEIDKEKERLFVAEEERQKAVYQFGQMAKPKWYESDKAYKAAEEAVRKMSNDLNLRNAALNSRQRSYEAKIAQLASLCSTDDAKAKIQKIREGILIKNKPIADRYLGLIEKEEKLTGKITEIRSLKKGVDQQVYKDRGKNISYSTSGGGASMDNRLKLPNPVNLIAHALNQDQKVVGLVAKIQGDQEVDFSFMTSFERQAAIAKMDRD